MGIMEIAGVIISLVTTFGPKAVDIWNDWHTEVGDNPTPEQWAVLKKKIEDHNPDTY